MTRNIVSPMRVRDKYPTKKLQALINAIQAKNASIPEDEVIEDVTQAVEEVRQERFLESIRQASARKSG